LFGKTGEKREKMLGGSDRERNLDDTSSVVLKERKTGKTFEGCSKKQEESLKDL
jgi:hypothetical protein